MAGQQVFISYAWGGESEIVANEVEQAFQKQGIDLVRDKSDLGFKGLIREFMQKIGQGNLVILIISDKYLKSKNCMFELMELERKGEFFDRIFPIVLPDADIYDSLGILNYLKYWDQKIKDLNASAKELDNLADTRKVQEDINLYTDIRGAIDDLAGKLSNMNTLTVEIMRARSFQPLMEALLAQREKPKTDPAVPSKKEGKVLYHIPGMMQVNSWTRCTVRLAWEEILLTEGLKIPEKERTIESIRLGSVMQVSLNEGRDGHNFEIKPLNNEEQFITEDDFTEWLFDVKPLSTGNFTLILRVTLIQIIEGKERKKDVVLERNVITEAVVPKALARFETAEDGLTPLSESNKDFPFWEESFNPDTDYPEVFAEMIPGAGGQATHTSHRPPLSGSPVIQNQPAPNRPEVSGAPKPTTFRRILPYAASLAALVVVGALFFPMFSSTEDSQTASIPEEEIYYQEDIVVGRPPKQKMLVAMSMESTAPTGETITEVMAFMISSDELDSLNLIDPGNYSLQVLPAADTAVLNFGLVKTFTFQEIQDSVKKASVSPARIGNTLIERTQLQVIPESQVIQTEPQRLDSASAKKLRRSTRVRVEN